jgi:hypothetical protein
VYNKQYEEAGQKTYGHNDYFNWQNGVEPGPDCRI